MTTFSYDVLKCILKHLPVEKRALLAERCPAVKKIERRMDLHLDFLHFGAGTFSINGTHCAVLTLPNKLTQLTFKHSTYKHLSLKSPQQLLKKIVDYYLGERIAVNVQLLECGPFDDIIPEELRIQCQEVTIISKDYVDTMENIRFHLVKLPVDKLTIRTWQSKERVLEKLKREKIIEAKCFEVTL